MGCCLCDCRGLVRRGAWRTKHPGVRSGGAGIGWNHSGRPTVDRIAWTGRFGGLARAESCRTGRLSQTRMSRCRSRGHRDRATSCVAYQAGDQSRVLDMADGDLSAITLTHVLDGAREGDGVAISVVRDTVKYIGMAVANLATTVDPEIIVLGGMVQSAGDLLLEPLRHECARRWRPPCIAV